MNVGAWAAAPIPQKMQSKPKHPVVFSPNMTESKYTLKFECALCVFLHQVDVECFWANSTF